MKKYRLMTLVLVGLLMLPGLMSAEDAGSTHYEEMAGYYEAIRLALLADSMDGVTEDAKALEEKASSLLQNITRDQAGVSAHDLENYAAAVGDTEIAARKLAEASDLDAAREEFFVLTKPMAKHRKLAGDETTIVAYCPMAQKAWIQPDREIGNPYMGQEMPTCGEVVGEG
jgi:hypothetical protein